MLLPLTVSRKRMNGIVVSLTAYIKEKSEQTRAKKRIKELAQKH